MFENLQFNFFSLALITSGSFGIVLGLWIMAKRRRVFNWFSIMLGAASWWAIAYGFELATTDLSQMLAWIKVEYLGISALPALWLVFCYSFIGRANRLNAFTYISLFGYSLTTYLMMLTNEQHLLFYEAVSVDRSGPFPLLSIVPGPWYHLHTAVFYILVIAGYWSMLSHARHVKAIFRKQNYLIIFSTLVPLLVNFGYIFLDWRPFGHLDLTPFAFLLTSFIIAIGLMRLGLFDVSPMARIKVIQDLNDGVAVLDSDGRLIDYNPSFEKMAARTDDIFGLGIVEVLLGEEQNEELNKLDEQGLKDFIVTRQDGKVFEINANGLFEKSGLYVGSAFTLKDVTEREANQRKLQEKTEELIKLNSLKDRLFSIIAHDLRGPMLNLQETLKLINSNALEAEDRDELLKLLGDNVGQNVNLMKNLLDWALSQQKGERLELSLFKIGEVFQEAIEPLMPSIEKKEQALERDIPEQSMVYADRERIKIVVRNLINNSIKFTPVKGKIKIWTEQRDGKVSVYIRDNGIGMTEKQLAKIASQDELESTEGTLKEKGTGLGLMLCRDFLRQHDCELKVQSELGFGSTFSFCLSSISVENRL